MTHPQRAYREPCPTSSHRAVSHMRSSSVSSPTCVVSLTMPTRMDNRLFRPSDASLKQRRILGFAESGDLESNVPQSGTSTDQKGVRGLLSHLQDWSDARNTVSYATSGLCWFQGDNEGNSRKAESQVRHWSNYWVMGPICSFRPHPAFRTR